MNTERGENLGIGLTVNIYSSNRDQHTQNHDHQQFPHFAILYHQQFSLWQPILLIFLFLEFCFYLSPSCCLCFQFFLVLVCPSWAFFLSAEFVCCSELDTKEGDNKKGVNTCELFKKIYPEEFQYRKNNHLQHKCGDKYVPGHQCKNEQYTFMLLDDKEELEFLDLEEDVDRHFLSSIFAELRRLNRVVGQFRAPVRVLQQSHRVGV